MTEERTMTRKIAVAGAVVALVLGTTVGPVQAQGGPGARGRGGPNLGGSVAVALEHQEELGLTRDQVAKLQEMKGILDQQVAPLAEEMRALRESIRNGEVDRAEGLREMEALRGELITAGAPLRGTVQEVFTVAQHRQLQALVRPDRPGLGQGGVAVRPGAGRMGARQLGRGGRMGIGFRQGLPGQGRGQALGFRRGLAGAASGAPLVRALRLRRGIGG